MTLTPEQHYINKKWPVMSDKFEKKACIFSYDDMMDFADAYHQAKIAEAEDKTIIERHMKKLSE